MNNKEKADLMAEEMICNLKNNVLQESAETDKAKLLSLLFLLLDPLVATLAAAPLPAAITDTANGYISSNG